MPPQSMRAFEEHGARARIHRFDVEHYQEVDGLELAIERRRTAHLAAVAQVHVEERRDDDFLAGRGFPGAGRRLQARARRVSAQQSAECPAFIKWS